MKILYKIKKFLKLNRAKQGEPKLRNVTFFPNVEFVNSKIGIYSYIARNSIVHNTTIGNFCSIGPNAVIGYGDHPTHLLSTSPAFYSKTTNFDLKPEDNLFFGHQPVEIGSDVWIGANVFVKNGIKIGHGSIIGAGAVVLTNVAPYSIVVGVPAKNKSFRFEVETIDKLLELQWWDFPEEILKEHYQTLISSNILNNLDQLFNIKNSIK